MPPVSAPKRRSAPKAGTQPTTSAQEQTGGSRAESPTDTSPRSAPKAGRRTNRDNLKDRLERFYIMMGTILVPFARFFPALDPIGSNLKNFAAEATDAWMELADSDPKVKSYLESITGASTWGNVIGIHFAIFATAIPTNSAISAAFGGSNSVDPIDLARAAGLSEEEIAEAVRMGEQMGGGPGDTIRSDRSPQEAGPPPSPKTNGIVSPEDLGVVNQGHEHDQPIPADPSPPSGA